MTLPDRDPAKTSKEQGLFHKFNVHRADGSDAPGGKHHGCEYFVLDLDHDPYARATLMTYAYVCGLTHPALAADLRRRYSRDGNPNGPTQDKIDLAEALRRGFDDDIGELLSLLIGEVPPDRAQGVLSPAEFCLFGFGPSCPCGERGLAPGEELVETPDGEVCADCAKADGIGICEGCRKPIYQGQKHHTCAGGEPVFCEACAPMLSEILSQYEEVLKAPLWEPGELAFDTPEELAAAIKKMRAEIAGSGDRKAVWS